MADFTFANNPGQPNYAGPMMNFMAPMQNGQQQQQQRPGQPQQAPWNQPQGPGNPMQTSGPNAGTNAPVGMSFSDRLRAFMSQQGGQPGFNTPAMPLGGPSTTAIY